MMQRLLDLLPDIVTTTAQCVRQTFDSEFDLATLPPRRRREFTQHRCKYTRRVTSPEIMDRFGAYESLLGLLGDGSRYTFTQQFAGLDALATKILAEGASFDFLELYALDQYQHWNLDNDPGMREVLGKVDRFVAKLREGCARSGQTLVLLVDHGQELVTNRIPMLRTIRNSGVPRAEYSYYCEVGTIRLWFHTENARATITSLIKQLPSCQLLHFSDMHQYHVCFDDSRFGEYYALADAGSIFFPHDFYHPLAGLYLGLVRPSQRSRIFNPVHRGNHGYLPHFPSEKGLLVVADDNVTPAQRTMSLIDFAPTMLAYLGAEIPSHMTGQDVLTACRKP